MFLDDLCVKYYKLIGYIYVLNKELGAIIQKL